MENIEKKKPTEEEIARLEKFLEEKEFNLYDHYCQAGKTFLDAAECENKKISTLVDEIIEAKKKLMKMKQTKSCQNCMTINDNDSVYCKRCGQLL